MKVYIVTTVIGALAIDDMDRVLSFRPFPKDSAGIADRLRVSETRMTGEERAVFEELKGKGYRDIIFSRKKEGAESVEPGNTAENYVRKTLFDIAMKHGFARDRVELNQLLTKVNIELAKGEIRKALKKDAIAVQANGAIEELEKSANIFSERLREWYGFHFPEMDRAVASHEKFAKLVEAFGRRERMDEKGLKSLAEKSMGMDLSEPDIAAVQKLASEIGRLYGLRDALQKYMEGVLREVAPNFTEIAGPAVAAKLLSRAGSLEKLAKMTSNTIQLLGSEKALFRFLHSREKTGSPKYGVIFSHPLIQNAPQEKRGKVARVLSSKLSMAVKIDFFSREDKSAELKRDLEEKIKEVMSAKKE